MDIEFRNRLLALFAPLFWSLTGLVIRLLANKPGKAESLITLARETT